MESQNPTLIFMLISFFAVILAATNGVGGASSSIDQDRAECADQLVGLATCLAYVGGDAKAPSVDCCSGLKQVVDKSKKCLCVLLKDRDNPNLGIKLNSTLALGLPTACHVPTNISKCVELLHLDPNSSDAKMFEDFAKHQGNSTIPMINGNSLSHGSSGSSSNEKNDGGIILRGKRWHGLIIIEMAFGAFMGLLAPLLLLHV